VRTLFDAVVAVVGGLSPAVGQNFILRLVARVGAVILLKRIV
jgi:hypothetical protein